MKKDDRLIYLISMAQLALRTRINTLFAEAGLRVTLPQATVLFLLTEKDCRMMSEMGRIIGVDNSAMTGLVDRLEKAGLVRREAKREDRRALLIRITPEGRNEAGRAAKIIRGVNEKIREGFEAGQIEAFKEVLRGVIEKLKLPPTGRSFPARKEPDRGAPPVNSKRTRRET
jgi:MarR family transcriptional regulator, organic hydroperoxide resistance regulator